MYREILTVSAKATVATYVPLYKKTSHDLCCLRLIPLLVQYTIFIVHIDQLFRVAGREGAI